MPVLDAEDVIQALQGAAKASASRHDLLLLTAHKVRSAGAPYTSVYLYMLHQDQLLLEAFSGRETQHHRISVGHGVCGTAVAQGSDQNVGDVSARENYIACNSFTTLSLLKSRML